MYDDADYRSIGGPHVQFDAFTTVFVTAAFLVPGFIASAVMSMFVARRSTSLEGRAHEYLTLSCVNHGFWSWLIWLAYRDEWLNRYPIGAGVVLFGILFVFPVLMGWAFGCLRQGDHVGRFLDRLGFRVIRQDPTAWDYFFSRAQPCWVIVTLQSGSRLYGFFGIKSFAGDDPQSRDLYLEAVYRLTDGGEWAPVEDSRGIWIASDQIASLEFREAHEVNNGDSTKGEDSAA